MAKTNAIYDVLIVGAGPAGATAAKLLADAGRSVLLLEAVKPAEKVCGGWVSKLAGSTFPWLERAAGKLTDTPFSGLIFHSPDLSKSAEFVERGKSGWLVDRAVFDAGLAALAADAGAEVQYNRRVVKTAYEEEAVRVWCEKGQAYAGRVLLAADGAGRHVAQSVFRGHSAPPSMMGIGATIRSKAPKLEKIFGKNRSLRLALSFGGLAGYGYAYARKSAVAVGLVARGLHSSEAPAKFNAFVAAMLAAGLLPDEASGPLKPAVRLLPDAAALENDEQVGKRMILIGDAGGFAGAVVGEGIYPAMWSAKLAAETVIDAFKAAKFQDALLGFKRRWRTEMAEHLRMPNTNMSFLLPLIFSNQQMTDRFAKAVLYGKNI